LGSGGADADRGRSEDHLVEITLTMLAAYGSFLLAEELHVSGVLAAGGRRAGGQLGQGPQANRGRRQGGGPFWDFAGFLANSVVFLLIGSRGRCNLSPLTGCRR
jgi:CPA1 family monovalent cation:H+ antiporter